MKISDRQPKISDSLKISEFSNSLGVLQHLQAPPAIRLWASRPLGQVGPWPDLKYAKSGQVGPDQDWSGQARFIF